jgi:hypothetical protein
MQTILQQIRGNSVALISLMTAVIALSYNTWRNETTESQRNIRQASFQVLESLGDLQEVADYRYYYFPFEGGQSGEGELRLRGYGSVTMVRDLMNLMPPPAPAASDKLFRLWNAHVNTLTELDGEGHHTENAKSAENELATAIKQARAAVIHVLKKLD